MKKFDFYEFTGVLCPGAVAVFGLSKIYPALGLLITNEKASLGDLGVFVILSYVVGHLLQAVGNLLEKLWWFFWRGMPSDWVRSGKHKLLAKKQQELLPAKIKELLGLDCDTGISRLSNDDWFMITRQIYSSVKHAERAERIDIFNGNYGMFRGICSSLLVIAIASLVELGRDNWKLYALLFIGIVLSLLRMHRFAVHYSRELFVQFLNTSKEDKAPPKKKDADE